VSIYTELATPAVIIDLDRMENNISQMSARLAECGIGHRPHIKSHKSVAIAAKQLQAGAIGITVAKLSEAEVFVDAGITSIMIAYAIVGADKLARFAALHGKAELIVTVDSLHAAEGLAGVGAETGKPVRAVVEIDGGLHRGGRQPGADALSFALAVNAMQGIEVVGIMGYFGTIYSNTDEQGFIEATRRESAVIGETAELFRQNGLSVEVVSTGSSPASIMCRQLDGISEVRAGNYIFFDASGVGMGLAKEEDCALRVIATVISTPLPGRATIDAGTKTLTSDKAHHREGFGIVVGRPELTITGLNEEHGFLQFNPGTAPLCIGDRIEIIPNHSCVLPNLCDRVAGVRGGRLEEWISVDARGCNY